MGRMSHNKLRSGMELFAFSLAYGIILVARNSTWLPDSWSFLPVVETAWLNLLLVVVLVAWLVARGTSLALMGLKSLPQARVIVRWVVIIMIVDGVATGIATPVLESIFGIPQPVSRFADVPGNLPLLLTILPLVWLIAAFGEEFFFRGFLLTRLAELFGDSRWAWGAAVSIQAVAFGAIHAYQGSVGMILIGIGALVYGAAFVLLGRNLWPMIFAHGINDSLGFILLYAGVIQA